MHPDHPPGPPPPPNTPQQGRIRRLTGKWWIKYPLVLIIGIAIGSAATGSDNKDDKKNTNTAAEPAPVVTVFVTQTVTAAPAPAAPAPSAAAPAATTPPPPPATTPAPPAPATTVPGDGIHLVGTDIQPGTYRSENPGNCYWERLSALDGEFTSIIANNFAKGTAVVTIAKTDKAFKTSGCADWKKIG